MVYGEQRVCLCEELRVCCVCVESCGCGVWRAVGVGCLCGEPCGVWRPADEVCGDLWVCLCGDLQVWCVETCGCAEWRPVGVLCRDLRVWCVETWGYAEWRPVGVVCGDLQVCCACLAQEALGWVPFLALHKLSVNQRHLMPLLDIYKKHPKTFAS